jgi:hypothetical protein
MFFRSPKKLRSPKSLIRTSVTLHDQTQIEAIFDYHTVLGNKRRIIPQKLSYELEAFFFLPRSFGITVSSYPKEKFYSDLRPLIRFREPKLGYKQIMGLRDSDLSPLQALRDFADLETDKVTDDDISEICREMKLFSCIYVGYLWPRVNKLSRRFSRLAKVGPVDEEQQAAIEKFATDSIQLIARLKQIHQEFLRLKEKIDNNNNAKMRKLHVELKAVDEYCCYREHDALAVLLQATLMHLDSDIPKITELKAVILDFSQMIVNTCDTSGYMLIEDESPRRLKENYVRRRSYLKNHMWTPLFLEMRKKPMFSFQQHFGAMIAAGLAAMWAVVAQIMVISKIMSDGDLSNLYGVGGFLFLTAAIMAYVVKDRIKELGRSYFRGGLLRKLPDHSEKLSYTDYETGDEIQIGSFRESTEIRPETELPNEVKNLRGKFTQGYAGDESERQVIHYKKDVFILGKVIRINRYPLRIVHDILRFDISTFLGRLGNHEISVNCINRAGELQTANLPKIYHLDLVLKHSKKERGHVTNETFEYLRLVIDKTGLQRVEHLN